MAKVKLDDQTLRMAIVGYQSQIDEIYSRMAIIETSIRKFQNGARPTYKLSPAARKRISEAQKKRWQHYRREKSNA